MKTDEINLGKKFKAEIKAETELKLSDKEKEFNSKFFFKIFLLILLDNDIEKLSNMHHENIENEFNDKNNNIEDI